LGRARSSLCRWDGVVGRWDGVVGGGGAEFLRMLAGAGSGRCGLGEQPQREHGEERGQVRRAAGTKVVHFWRCGRPGDGPECAWWQCRWVAVLEPTRVAAAVSSVLPGFTGMGVPAWSAVDARSVGPRRRARNVTDGADALVVRNA
jgi:hypothetical protein